MNTIRILAFVTAVLLTALLLLVVTYSLPIPQSTQAVAGTVASTQSTQD